MSAFDLNLPIDIPWQVIAASPDLIDITFCNKQFPFDWRSSLALSVYEPKPESLPEELCGRQITYLKVTASITGYQASKDEAASLLGQTVAFGDVPLETANQILDEYWACYSVLLNVAVFPLSNTIRRPRTAKVDFSSHVPRTKLANPYTESGISIEVADHASNPVVDLVPAGGDGKGELDLGERAEARVPPSTRVTVTVGFVAAPEGEDPVADLRLEIGFLSGDDLIAIRELAPAPDPQIVAVEGADITRVTFRAAGGQASMVSIQSDGADEVPVGLNDYPHIMDFEPKNRDLYQASTETGEVLTASDSRVSSGKSHVHTNNTQTGLSYGSKSRSGSDTIFAESTMGLTRQWGDTEQDSNTLQTDASRDRRERQATSTSISQMYNLLTGYHLGTNRALFLMLPRPHLLQPTDRRTFVQGVRVIEGVQEFLLIVDRPGGMKGLCVEAYLETGHFPENVTENKPAPATNTRPFRVRVSAGTGDTATIEDDPQSTYTAPSGWIIDQFKGDAEYPGVSEIAVRGNEQANNNLRNYNYRAISDTQAQVFGTIHGGGLFGSGALFDRSYRVFLVSQQPPTDPSTVNSPFLLTSRGLCACFLGGNCPTPVTIGYPVTPPSPEGATPVPPVDIPTLPAEALPQHPSYQSAPAASESVVYEGTIALKAPITAEARLPGVKELLRTLHSTMATNWRSAYRVPRGIAGLLDTDYAISRLMGVLPGEILGRTLDQIEGLPPEVLEAFGPRATAGEILKLGLRTMAARIGLNMETAVIARRLLLGIQPPPRTPPAGDAQSRGMTPTE